MTKEEQAKLIHDRSKDAWKKVCQTVEGRAVLLEIIHNGGAFASIGANIEPHAMYYNVGRKELGYEIMSTMESVSPNSLEQARRELDAFVVGLNQSLTQEEGV